MKARKLKKYLCGFTLVSCFYQPSQLLAESQPDNTKSIQYTTLLRLKGNETDLIKFKYINSRTAIDTTVQWYVTNLERFIHSDAKKIFSLVKKGNRSISILEKELDKTIVSVSKNIESVLKRYIDIQTNVDLFYDSGIMIIKEQDKIIEESKSKLLTIKELENAYKSDQSILLFNIKRSKGNEKERLQKFYSDWKETNSVTLQRVNDIYSNIEKLRKYMIEVKDITRPFLKTLIKQIPQEVRLGYDNTFTTLRAEQTCPCYKELKSSRISLLALTKIFKKEIDIINNRIPDIYDDIIEISKKMGYKERHKNKESIWLQLTEIVNEYKNNWNSVAGLLETWNKAIWIQSLEEKSPISLESEISYKEWDEVNRVIIQKTSIFKKGTRLDFVDNIDNKTLLLRNIKNNTLYAFDIKNSLPILSLSHTVNYDER